MMKMSSTLWKNDTFINDNINYLFNKEITEYDMSEAGFSLIREFKLLDDKTIKKLSTYSKDKRKIEIGKIQRDNDTFKKMIKESFPLSRRFFFEYNSLEDDDIISIKKDAIITTKHCSHTKIGNYINFRPKHFYTSYIHLNKRLELYYSPEDFAVKGISDNLLKEHEDYMIKFIKLFFKKMETEDNSTVIEFTRHFIDKYKNRELDIGYYRNFDNSSKFITYDKDIVYTECWDEFKDEIDISYNFYNILLKIIKIPL